GKRRHGDVQRGVPVALLRMANPAASRICVRAHWALGPPWWFGAARRQLLYASAADTNRDEMGVGCRPRANPTRVRSHAVHLLVRTTRQPREKRASRHPLARHIQQLLPA